MSADRTDDASAALDQTETALAGPLPALTPTVALGLIDTWRSACGEAGAVDVVEGLDRLRGMLTADRLNGRALAGTLRELATSTRSASDVPDLLPRLRHIADLLERGAAALGG